MTHAVTIRTPRPRRPPWRALVACALTSSIGTTQAQPTVELAPWTGMQDQFTLSLPAGWSVLDQQEAVAGRRAPTGPPVVFSAEAIDAAAMRSGDRDALRRVIVQLAGVEVGRIPGFMLDRLPARAGMACAGFDAAAVDALLTLMRTDPMFGRERTVRQPPQARPIDVGGCVGQRVHGQGTTATGAGKNLDVVAMSDGRVLYLFKLLNTDEHRPKNLPLFEHVLSTVQLARRD